MKITFPHIGDAHIIGRLFFQEIGIDIISPPSNTIKGLEEGSSHSPDEICLPFKLMVSNLMEAHRLGADTVVMPATMGPCRLGEYGELLKSIFDKKGYAFDWIILDASKAIGSKELLRRLSRIIEDSDKSILHILIALHGTYKIIKRFELLEKKARILCGYEINKGDCKKTVALCRKEIKVASSIKKALHIITEHIRMLSYIAIDKEKHPLKLLLTGEIYSLIDSFGNHHLEELLMDMGVSFEKRITLGWWIDNTLLNPLTIRQIARKKNSYLPLSIGGYAKETVEEGILCNHKNYDGIVQIFPVGCMPEIVAKAVFSKMSKELNIKVLTIIFDEMAGEAGYITRIEAFVDLLNRRKKRSVKNGTMKRHGGKTNVLFGN